MPQPIFPATVAYDHNKASYVEEYIPSQTAGETFIYGDFVVLAAATVKRCGTDPATILGLSEISSEAGRVITPNGKVPVRVLDPELVLCMSSTTVPVDATHMNQLYGITRTAGGVWQVDVAKTGGSARLTVVRLDIPNGIWYVKILASVLSNDGIVA